MKPTFTDAYSICGLILEIENFPEKALDYYKTAYALNRNNSIILENLERIKKKLDQKYRWKKNTDISR